MFDIIYDNNTKISNINDTEHDFLDDLEPVLCFTDINEYFVNKIFNNEIEWKESTCTVNGNSKTDLTKRNSLTNGNKYIINSKKINEYLENNNFANINIMKFELLKYEIGGFFLKHRDKLYSNSRSKYLHTHTCLLYPPSALCSYEGGDLIIYNEDNKTQIINTSLFTDWTFIIFDQKTYHEITPTITGKRHVFKGQLYKINDNFKEIDSYDELCD